MDIRDFIDNIKYEHANRLRYGGKFPLKYLIAIVAVCVVLIIGIVVLIVNLSKEPTKVLTTELTESLGYNLAKEYYKFSDKKSEKYFSIENIDDAYNSLIEGKCDVIISPLPDDEVIARLNNENIEIEKYIISRDAFVFLNNSKNQVIGLKSEDIKKIYSKAITNWSELGGENLDILAYQSKSGETLYYAFKKYMGDYTLEKPKIRLQDESLNGLINAITNYLDTRKSAIGYTNYNALKNTELPDNCRVLKVDGEKVDDVKIFMDEYPATFDIYVIVRKDAMKSSQVKKLVEYILSEKGQDVIRESGYIVAK